MAIYFCYLLLAGVQVPFFFYRKKDALREQYFDSKKYLILCCAELILLAGFRGYTVGADTAKYLRAVDYYSRFSVSKLLTAKLVWPFDFEAGYFALTKLSVLLGIGKTGHLFVVALLTYIPVFCAIKRHSTNPYISILCYFAFGMFSYSLGIFRQMIAISILFCGWKYVAERKIIPYLITVGIAMLFHTSAIIALALYFLYGIKWEHVLWAVLGIEVALLVFGRPVIMFAMKLIPRYAGYIGGRFDQQGGSYAMLLLLNIALFANAFLRKKGRAQDDMTICALIIAVCLQAIGYSMEIFGRVVPYFSVYLIFAVPNIINGMHKKWRVIVIPCIVLCLFLLTFMEFNGNKYVTPYYTIFDELAH